MNKLYIVLIFFSCVTVNDRSNLKIEPIAFETCYLQNLSPKLLENKNQFSKCDFIFISEINSIDISLQKKIESFFEPDSILIKSNSSFECKNLSELQNINQRQNQYKTNIFCYKKNIILEIAIIDYIGNDEFTNPIFFILIDLVNQRKILFSDFLANPDRRRELIEFDKLISFTSQNFSDRKPFFSGKFFLNTKYHSEIFLKNLSFPYILVNLTDVYNKEKTDFSILTDSITFKNCKSAERKSENFYQLKCEF